MNKPPTLRGDMGDTRQSKSTGAARCTGAEAWGRLLVGLGDHVRKQPAADAALGAFRWDPTRDMQRVALTSNTSDRQADGRTSQ